MSVFSTMPGTLTKVMPEMLAPIMPNATMYQGDRWLPRKNVSLLERRAVRRLNMSRTMK